MNEVKVLSNAISEAITAVKYAEKCCLDIDWAGKLDIVKDLMATEKQLQTIRDCVPVPAFRITEQTEITDLYEEGLLSLRAYNVLKRADCDTVEDIIAHTEEEIIRFRNMGRKSATEILDLLHKNGLYVKDDRKVNTEGKEDGAV